jgi:hypothetical protein
MKKLFLFVAGMLFAVTSFAQNTVVASLSHGTNVTYFYGADALKQAEPVAESGDIISLSGGTFNGTDITKAITLRGAGIDSAEPTYIIGNFNIWIPTEDANRFTMEGIRCTGTMYTKGTFANPYFVKCQFVSLQNATESDAVTDQMFVNCKITDHVNVGGNNTVTFLNSYVTAIGKYQNGDITVVNCIVNQRSLRGLTQSTWNNCIIFCNRYSEDYLPADAQVTNCITPKYNGGNHAYDIYRNLVSHPGTAEFEYATTFKAFTGNYSDTESFEMTDEGKAKYLGTDGTEIGLYGGMKPYSSRPSYPLITTMTVGNATDTEGQLSVTIGIDE